MIEKMFKEGWKAKFGAVYDYVRYPRERKKNRSLGSGGQLKE